MAFERVCSQRQKANEGNGSVLSGISKSSMLHFWGCEAHRCWQKAGQHNKVHSGIRFHAQLVYANKNKYSKLLGTVWSLMPALGGLRQGDHKSQGIASGRRDKLLTVEMVVNSIDVYLTPLNYTCSMIKTVNLKTYFF